MDQESNQLIFLIGLQHYMGHSSCGASHTDLEEVECSFELLQGGVDAPTVVVKHQEVYGVKLSVLLADEIDVSVKERKGWTEAF